MATRKPLSGADSTPSVFPRRILWGFLLGLICVLVLGVVVLAQGGNVYTLRRSVLSGGGARAEGNDYVIHYSFGQPSTIGRSTGAVYQLRQGYWRAVSTPMPTPTLTPPPTCPPHACDPYQKRVYGHQPHRFETVRPIFNAAAGRDYP